MALSFAINTANAILNQITARIDLGAAAGTIVLYSGSIPTNANTALAGNTVLATLTCADPSAAAAASKTLTLNAITQDSSADATGDATFFRVMDSDANVVLQGSVSAVGGGGDLQMNTVSVVAGGPVQITSCSFTLP
jgi:uncharacterized protein with beta-barrel porin domain